MLNFINRNLFNVDFVSKRITRHGTSFTTDINSVDSTFRTDWGTAADSKRIIMKAATKSDADITTIPVRLQTKRNDKNNSQNILITECEKGEADTDVFAIAIPYAGHIKPIGLNYDFCIYKGCLVRAKEKFNFPVIKENPNTEREYNNVFYLALVPSRRSLESKDPRFHKDTISLVVESYRNIEDANVDYSIKDTFTLTCRLDEEGKLKYEYSFTQESSTYFNQHDFKDQKLFCTYIPRDDRLRDTNIDGVRKDLRKSGFVVNKGNRSVSGNGMKSAAPHTSGYPQSRRPMQTAQRNLGR